MILRASFWLLPILVLATPGSAWLQAGSLADVGIWSKEANSISYTRGTRKVEIKAPDKKKSATIDGVTLLVLINGKRFSGTEDHGVETLAELSWAPDSSAFFVTSSDGGLVGTWQTRVYLVERTRVRKVDVTKEVQEQFKTQYACQEPEEPNIAAIKWLGGSRRLLLVTEVPPHSSCPEMGKTRGYIVSIPDGKIIEQFGPDKLAASWGHYLGARLSQKEKEQKR